MFSITLLWWRLQTGTFASVSIFIVVTVVAPRFIWSIFACISGMGPLDIPRLSGCIQRTYEGESPAFVKTSRLNKDSTNYDSCVFFSFFLQEISQAKNELRAKGVSVD